MRQTALILSFLFIASAVGRAQGSSATPQSPPEKPGPRILTWTPPEHPTPPFGSQIRKAVSVVRETCRDQDGKLWQSSGTGFIVSYHDPRLAQPDQNFEYLVTNRHVAECMDDDLHPRQVLAMSLEVNMKNGKTAILPYADRSTVPSWRFPVDYSIDLAVLPIVPTGDFVPVVVPLDMVFSKEDFAAQNIGEGARIVMSGYFYQLDGENKFEPLVREGVLSMVPDGPLRTSLRKPGRIYLGEVHVFGGNSGSPVFISMDGIRPSGITVGDNYLLLGIVSGYYYEDSDFRLQIATTVTGTQRANSGISMIVPADLLKDLILHDPQLASIRDSAFRIADKK